MQVQEFTKNQFLDGTTPKHLEVKIIQKKVGKEDGNVSIKSLTISEENIIADSMTLKESAIATGDFYLGGCITSTFSITLINVKNTLFEKFGTYTLEEVEEENCYTCYHIESTIYTQSIDKIPLFHGRINSSKSSEQSSRMNISAVDDFDALKEVQISYKEFLDVCIYNKFPLTLAEVYKRFFSWLFNTKLKEPSYSARTTIQGYYTDFLTVAPMRDALFQFDPLGQNKYSNTDFVNAYTMIQAVCDINCMMGIINRSNRLEIRSRYSVDIKTNSQSVEPYKSLKLDFTDFVLSNSTEIKRADGGFAKYVGKPFKKNIYAIVGNWLIDSLGMSVLGTEDSADSFEGLFGYPAYTVVCQGRPWIECCREPIKVHVQFHPNDVGDDKLFEEYEAYVFDRTLSGIQNLTDTYTFEPIYNYDNRVNKNGGNMSRRMDNLESSKPTAQYVTEIPTEFQSGTVYYIRK